MSETIPNLWPQDFKIDVQTPLTILRVQANMLGKVTKGILTGIVESEVSRDGTQHRLVIIAPAYNSYRHTLITAYHKTDLPYPVEIRATGLEERDEVLDIVYPSANSDEHMIHIVRKVLRSVQTGAVILSLIAKSNEDNEATKTNAAPDLPSDELE
jgi:hypothetical protein